MKIKILLLVIVLFFQNLFAVRPIISEDPQTVGERVFSIESGLSYDNKNPSYDVSLLYGFTRDIEIAIKTNYVGAEHYFYNGAHFKYSFNFFTTKIEYLKNINLHESVLSIGFTKYIYNKKDFSFFGTVSFIKNTLEKDMISYSFVSSFNSKDKIFYIDLFFESNTNDFSKFKKHIFRPLFGLNYILSDNIVFDFGYMIKIFNKQKESETYIGGLSLYF